MPAWLACMVSIMMRIRFIVATVGSIRVTICGISASSCRRSGISSWMWSVVASIPSSPSKIDRIDQHTGMS